MVTMSDSLMYPVMCNLGNTAIAVKQQAYFCRIVNHLAQIVTDIQKHKTTYKPQARNLTTLIGMQRWSEIK